MTEEDCASRAQGDLGSSLAYDSDGSGYVFNFHSCCVCVWCGRVDLSGLSVRLAMLTVDILVFFQRQMSQFQYYSEEHNPDFWQVGGLW